TVEALRVQVGTVHVQRAGTGVERVVVVADQRHGDAVGARLLLQVRHVLPAGGRPVVELVLHLVQQHRTGTVGQLVAGEDRVDVRQPLVGGREVVRCGTARVARLGEQPVGEAAAVDLGVDVRAGPGDDVEPEIGGDRQQSINVPYAGEVVDAGLRGVVRPGRRT